MIIIGINFSSPLMSFSILVPLVNIQEPQNFDLIEIQEEIEEIIIEDDPGGFSNL
jgi:low affinity Fe/Cu permease